MLGSESTTTTEYGPVQNVVLHAAKENYMCLTTKVRHEQAVLSQGMWLQKLCKTDLQLGVMCKSGSVPTFQLLAGTQHSSP